MLDEMILKMIMKLILTMITLVGIIFLSEIIMNIAVLSITRMIVTMMLEVILMIMIIIKNDIDKKKKEMIAFYEVAQQDVKEPLNYDKNEKHSEEL